MAFFWEFFRGGGVKNHCYTNFYCYAIFVLFSDKILGGPAKVSEEANCFIGGRPLRKKARFE